MRDLPIKLPKRSSAKVNNLRFYISRQESMDFIEKEAIRLNCTKAYIAQQIVNIALQHSAESISQLLEVHLKEAIKYKTLVDKAPTPPPPPPPITFVHNKLVFTLDEVKFMAHMVDLCRLESVTSNYKTLFDALGEDHDMTLRAFKHYMHTFYELGYILRNTYSTKNGDSCFTMHTKALDFVNKAIDMGFIDGF